MSSILDVNAPNKVSLQSVHKGGYKKAEPTSIESVDHKEVNFLATGKDKAFLVAMKVLLLLALATLGTASLQLKNEWEAWKREHGKSYADDMEESLRHAIWFQNYHYIEEHNKKESFQLGLNKFADLVQLYITACILEWITCRQ